MIQVCAKHHNQSWLNSPRALPTPSSLPTNSLPRRTPWPLATSRSEDPLAKVQVSSDASNRWCSLVRHTLLMWMMLCEEDCFECCWLCEEDCFECCWWKKTSTWNILKKQQHVECISYIYRELVTVHLRMHFRKPGPNKKRTKRLWQTNMSNKFYHPAPLWNQSQNASIYTFLPTQIFPVVPKKTELLSLHLWIP